MKRKVILICSWICVALTMLVIFCFSQQDSEKSSQTSSGVIEDVLDVVLPEEEVTPELVQKFQLPVRKIAHFSIFMVLGVCLANALRLSIPNKWYIVYPCAFIISVLYAISDEWHQSFSDGRSPSAIDVLIDSAGALFGIFLIIAFLLVYNRIKNKNPPVETGGISVSGIALILLATHKCVENWPASHAIVTYYP